MIRHQWIWHRKEVGFSLVYRVPADGSVFLHLGVMASNRLVMALTVEGIDWLSIRSLAPLPANSKAESSARAASYFPPQVPPTAKVAPFLLTYNKRQTNCILLTLDQKPVLRARPRGIKNSPLRTGSYAIQVQMDTYRYYIAS